MRVRLIHNPTRIGVLTGNRQTRSNRVFCQVQFPNNLEYKPEDQLEAVKENETPIDQLINGNFGVETDLRKVLIHAKVSGKMADVVYSMNVTNTDFYAYQFKPVLKILDSPSNGLLIADEVGLGKTIEAGLIWTELRMRHNFNRLMILCPAALREKWQNELSKRFGIQSDILSAKETLSRLRKNSKNKKAFAIIGSLQGLRPVKNYGDTENISSQASLARYLESAEHEEPIVDLLIVDEAHHMRNRGTQTRKLGHLFVEVSNFNVFLTATPVHNKNEDLFSLLQLLDPNTFNNEYAFDNILSANEPLVKARDLVLSMDFQREVVLEKIELAKIHPLLRENNQLDNILKFINNNGDFENARNKSILAHKLEYVNLLSNVLTRTRKKDVQEWRVSREPIPELVKMTTTERKYYEFVSQIVIDYAKTCDVNDLFLLAQPQRQLTSSIPASFRSWKQRWANKALLEDRDIIGPLASQIMSKTAENPNFDFAELKDNDSKYLTLRDVIIGILNENPDEKIVLFSTFRATLFYLNERLDEDEVQSIVMVGGQTVSKDEVIKEFSKINGPSILLSSEVGSEGVDMQFARFVINYDLPWNPMKVEQRIGRIDRLGQKADIIYVWNILYSGTIDSRIYEKLYAKLNLIQNSLGDFEAVLGDEIRKLEIELLSSELTPEEQLIKIEQTALALENLKKTEEELESQASNLVAYGDYVLNQIHTARDLQRWITAEDIRQYITDHLTLTYQGSEIKYLGTDEDVYSIIMPPEAKARFNRYVQQLRPDGKLLSRLNNSAVDCRFDNKISNAKNNRHVETVNQFHPFVKWVSHEINESNNSIRPTVAVRVDYKNYDGYLERGTYLLCINKWMFSGVRKLERLEYRGVLMSTLEKIQPDSAEKLSIFAALNGSCWQNLHDEVDSNELAKIANDHLLSNLQYSYEEFVLEQSAKNEDRLQIQLRNNKNNFERRLETLEEVKTRHQESKKNALIKATEGRIRRLTERTETIKEQIELNRRFTSENEELAIAVVKIE